MALLISLPGGLEGYGGSSHHQAGVKGPSTEQELGVHRPGRELNLGGGVGVGRARHRPIPSSIHLPRHHHLTPSDPFGLSAFLVLFCFYRHFHFFTQSISVFLDSCPSFPCVFKCVPEAHLSYLLKNHDKSSARPMSLRKPLPATVSPRLHPAPSSRAQDHFIISTCPQAPRATHGLIYPVPAHGPSSLPDL